ncbi:phosphatidylinositol synthase [Infundibulicybe gibba]|nr:phosphatidylinositol synthase [Infundibulicybe gibba]
MCIYKSSSSARRCDPKVAVDLATAQTYSENVFLFVPNIIGYARVILAGVSLHFMSYHPKYCTIAYVISCLLDAVDGLAARTLGQTSKFGAVLDMVTDRCTTSCLLCYLSSAYPDYAIVFQLLIALDFSSHYMHMYRYAYSCAPGYIPLTQLPLIPSSLVTGSRIMTATSQTTLFLICAGNELFFVSLYLMKWVDTPMGLPWILSSLSVAQLLACCSFLVCVLKNVINLVQLWKASKILVGVDLAERAIAREAKEAEKKRG